MTYPVFAFTSPPADPVPQVQVTFSTPSSLVIFALQAPSSPPQA